MAKIASKVLVWDGVGNDAANYFVRLIPQGKPFSYDAPALPAIPAVAGQAKYKLDLAQSGVSEGVYDVYITAADKAGNENDPFSLAGAVLDFTPPPKITSAGWQ